MRLTNLTFMIVFNCHVVKKEEEKIPNIVIFSKRKKETHTIEVKINALPSIFS